MSHHNFLAELESIWLILLKHTSSFYSFTASSTFHAFPFEFQQITTNQHPKSQSYRHPTCSLLLVDIKIRFWCCLYSGWSEWSENAKKAIYILELYFGYWKKSGISNIATPTLVIFFQYWEVDFCNIDSGNIQILTL